MRMCTRLRSVRSFLIAVALFGAASAVQAAVPSPWLAQDVGAPSPAGSSSYNSGTFTIGASGVDIWGTSDQFQFVYQQVTGDFSITARVDSLQYTDEWAKAGVMIRNSLSSTAREAFTGVTPAPGVTFQVRPSGGASTTSAGVVSGIGAPRWVRLTRSGGTITASMSVDGSQWTKINTITQSFNSTAYVGLAVTSHAAGVVTTASLSNVSITTGTSSSSALPSPQKAADIGSPAIQGSTTYNAGQYTIKAGGNDIWNTSDQFHYVYQPLSGDGEFIARVTGLGFSNDWAKAGLMVRETLTATSRHADSMITAGNGFTFQRRIDTGGTTVSTTGFSGTAPVWVRLVRTGYKFDAYRSTDGQTWSLTGSDTVPMTDPVYVGLAVTSHNTSVGTTAVLDNVSIKSGSGPNNQPPTVTLTSPTPGASFTAPATISLSANASDPENRMSHVDFYAGTTLLTSVSASPYSYTWSSVPAGTYSLTAVATDADGGTTTSAAVSVTVGGQSSDTQAPTAPAGLTASVASSTQINLSWTASTDNVGVTGYRIERCQGSGCTTFTQTGTSATTSYSATGLSASTSYSFRVRALDAAGNQSASSPVATASTTATPDTQAPTAPTSLTASAVSGTQVNLTWTASSDNVGVTA
jgi:regulation of enolase protein 1 (concanavalin A-like superfamily)/chitodextrinase